MFIAVSNRSSVRVFDSLVKYQIKPVFKHRGRRALGGGRLGHSLHKIFEMRLSEIFPAFLRPEKMLASQAWSSL